MKGSGTHLRVLIVDDSEQFVAGISQWFSAYPQIEVVGVARTGVEAVEHVARLNPDFILMDVVMPDMNGFDATRAIKTQPGAPRVVLASMYDAAEYRAAGEDAGADGYLSKSDVPAQLLPLLRRLFPDRFSSERGTA